MAHSPEGADDGTPAGEFRRGRNLIWFGAGTAVIALVVEFTLGEGLVFAGLGTAWVIRGAFVMRRSRRAMAMSDAEGSSGSQV
jgi:hypothetical protein